MQLWYEFSAPYARWNRKCSGRSIQKCLLGLEETGSCSCPKEKLLAWLLINFYNLYFWGLEISWHLLAPQCPRRTRLNFLSQNIELLMQKSRKNYYHLWHWSRGWNSCQQTTVWPRSRFHPGYSVTIVYKTLRIKITVCLQSRGPSDIQSQSTLALSSSALCWVSPAEMEQPKAAAGRVQAEESESSHAGLAAAAGSVWNACSLHAQTCHLCLSLPCFHLLGLGYNISTLCCHRPSFLPSHNFLPHNVLTYLLFHSFQELSCLPPRSSCFSPHHSQKFWISTFLSALHDFPAQLSHQPSVPIPVHEDHHCSTWC